MAVFDLEEDRQGSWFDFPGGGKIQIRKLGYSDWEQITKETTTKGPPEYPKLEGKYQRFQPDVVDENLQLDLIWDKTILAWEGLFDKNNKPIPCIREFKRTLMLMKDPSFRDFYNEKMKIILEVDKEQEAASEKN